MPLTYDDIPGSWGTYSEGWPALEFDTRAEAQRAFIACSLENVVPYGSYVMMNKDYRGMKKDTLRIETERQRDFLVNHLCASPMRTYHVAMMVLSPEYRKQYDWLMETYPPGHWNHEHEKNRRFPEGF